MLQADKAFLVTFFGAVVMLLGFILIYNQTGTFDLAAMRGTAIPGIAVLLILVGMLSKSATLPFHTWLPDAGVAPSPVTALLHAAVLVKIGVYVFARLFCYTFKLPEGWHRPSRSSWSSPAWSPGRPPSWRPTSSGSSPTPRSARSALSSSASR